MREAHLYSMTEDKPKGKVIGWFTSAGRKAVPITKKAARIGWAGAKEAHRRTAPLRKEIGSAAKEHAKVMANHAIPIIKASGAALKAPSEQTGSETHYPFVVVATGKDGTVEKHPANNEQAAKNIAEALKSTASMVEVLSG